MLPGGSASCQLQGDVRDSMTSFCSSSVEEVLEPESEEVCQVCRHDDNVSCLRVVSDPELRLKCIGPSLHGEWKRPVNFYIFISNACSFAFSYSESSNMLS